jgi:hypothetical protein
VASAVVELELSGGVSVEIGGTMTVVAVGYSYDVSSVEGVLLVV